VADPAKIFYKNPYFDGQLARTLAVATVDAADLGETMATARRVGKLNGQSWFDAWSNTADVARKTGDVALQSGDRVSARNAFLRASEYWRQAFYFVRANLDDPRLQRGYGAHVDTFGAALELLDIPAEKVQIPYEDTTVVGYFFAPADDGQVRPTLVFPCGYDSTAEAGWGNVAPAVERGYNALVFEGPGQGEALYTQRLFFRHDFEHVLSPVLDWLATRPEVDPARVGLIGRSFGGYLAPRAAAFEHRIAALVCDPAQPDMAARLPGGFIGKVATPVVNVQTRVSESRAEFFGARMAAHGIDSISRYFAELRRFTMLDDAKQITCPTLIIEADKDFAGGSGQELADAMVAQTELVHLTEAQGAEGHCAGLGQEVWASVVYGWLQKVLPTTTIAADAHRS